MTFNTVLIFSNDGCTLCEKAKKFAEDHHLEVEERSGEEIMDWPDYAVRIELQPQLAMNNMQLPVIFWRGEATNAATFKENIQYQLMKGGCFE